MVSRETVRKRTLKSPSKINHQLDASTTAKASTSTLKRSDNTEKMTTRIERSCLIVFDNNQLVFSEYKPTQRASIICTWSFKFKKKYSSEQCMVSLHNISSTHYGNYVFDSLYYIVDLYSRAKFRLIKKYTTWNKFQLYHKAQ